MNANELAELIEHLENAKYVGASKAATMLRQQQAEYYSLLVNHDKLYAKVLEQQAEIEALKKEAALQRLSDFTQEADNEPVAWMHKTYFPNGLFEEDLVWSKIDESSIPLYTHPAKTLTDEEIKFIAYPFESVYTTYDKQTDTDTVHTKFDQLGFARAILRKAQEK